MSRYQNVPPPIQVGDKYIGAHPANDRVMVVCQAPGRAASLLMRRAVVAQYIRQLVEAAKTEWPDFDYEKE